MVTGDNEQTASYIAQKLGIETYYFDATPDKKLEFQTTESTVILNINLGSEFNEHEFN